MNSLSLLLQKSALPILLTIILGAGGCAATFLFSKDCQSYFFGETGPVAYNMLCKSGDFENILETSSLPQDKKDALFLAQCGKRSGEMVKETYLSLTADQKKSLQFAFQQYGGYDINLKLAPNFRYGYYQDVQNFCPTRSAY